MSVKRKHGQTSWNKRQAKLRAESKVRVPLDVEPVGKAAVQLVTVRFITPTEGVQLMERWHSTPGDFGYFGPPGPVADSVREAGGKVVVYGKKLSKGPRRKR